mmetsp:Transcript_14139/g.34285  ORF Transcript_14139/g.34285 Transcript_14139/m.34285 type:complete len:217 (-) Transcript_14139:263-913(-)
MNCVHINVHSHRRDCVVEFAGSHTEDSRACTIVHDQLDTIFLRGIFLNDFRDPIQTELGRWMFARSKGNTTLQLNLHSIIYVYIGFLQFFFHKFVRMPWKSETKRRKYNWIPRLLDMKHPILVFNLFHRILGQIIKGVLDNFHNPLKVCRCRKVRRDIAIVPNMGRYGSSSHTAGIKFVKNGLFVAGSLVRICNGRRASTEFHQKIAEKLRLLVFL